MRKITTPSRKNVVSNTQLVASVRSSIFPPPDEMRQYESMNPGTFKVLVDTYKAQSGHRIELESAVIQNDIITAKRGQIFGFIIAMTVIIGGFVLIGLDKDVLGIASILGALGVVVGLFISRGKSRNNSLASKAQANPDNGNT